MNECSVEVCSRLLVQRRSLNFVRRLSNKLSKSNVAVCNLNHLTTTGNYTPYGITQYYLPPCSSDFPAFTPAEAGTRLSNSGGMQG